MNRRILRNLFGAAVALALTAMTTQTIVTSVQRPGGASDAPIAAAMAQPLQQPRAQLALCAGPGKALC